MEANNLEELTLQELIEVWNKQKNVLKGRIEEEDSENEEKDVVDDESVANSIQPKKESFILQTG